VAVQAIRSADGKYRVPWPQALRVTNFSRPVAADSGEPLQMDTRIGAILGALAGVATSSTVLLGGFIWLSVFERRHLLPIALVTLLCVVSIGCGVGVAVSRFVTFSRIRPES
jgi:hypothetical protein